MDVARGAREAKVPLGHEGDRLALRVGDFLGGVLEDHMAVGHGQRVSIFDVDLFLARAPFAFRILDRNAGGSELLAQRPHHALFLGGLEDVVILDVVAGGPGVTETLVEDRAVVLVEEVKFELAREVRGEAHLFEPGELRLQHGARRMRDRLMVMVVDEIAQDDCGPLEPGRLHQRRQVGLKDEVAIALFPACGLVAGHRFHIHVVGEEVVAAMRLIDRAFEEELGLEALADQPSLHVWKAAEHGVDRARGDVCFELGERVGHEMTPRFFCDTGR